MTWKDAWLELSRHLPARGLLDLAIALEADSAAVIHGGTVSPPTMYATRCGGTIDAACALGYVLWHGLRLRTCGEVETAMVDLAQTVGSVTFSVFTNWWDETDPNEVRAQLLDVLRSQLPLVN